MTHRAATYLTAVLRGLALFGLAMAGPAVFVLGRIVSVAGVLSVLRWGRWLPALSRRLAREWSEVDIPVPYRPEPAPPEPEPDGWYREGDLLFKSPNRLILLRRQKWVMTDPATYRDEAWMLLNPFVGGVLALLPTALIVTGIALPWAWTPWMLPLGLGAAVLGFVSGPTLLRLHGRWTRRLLAPTKRTEHYPIWAWGKRGAIAAARLGTTAGMAFVGLGLAILHVLSIYPAFMWTWPRVVLTSRQFVEFRRGQIRRFTGDEIETPYLPPPPLPPRRPDGTYRVGRNLHKSADAAARAQRVGWTFRDPATWRDLAWLAADAVVAVLLSAVPLVLVFGVFFGWLWAWMWSLLARPFFSFDSWWALRPLADLVPAPQPLHPVFGLPIGIALVLAGLAVSPPLLRAHSRWSKLLLEPTQAAVLAKRVAHLTEIRTEANDAQAAELRRIERDLHDGAQARLVSLGMHLGAVEQLIDRDPAAAKKLVAKAKENSAKALVELRELVRGIHPPVLAERGLVDAVRATALDSPLAVEVRAELAGRLDSPVESAAYFAISELLANAAKHSGASRVSVELRHTNGILRIVVTDNGGGGADAAMGGGRGGLRGLQRRLATFDGTLAISSPAGGPTTATLEIPCALSSPRTSTSSETA